MTGMETTDSPLRNVFVKSRLSSQMIERVYMFNLILSISVCLFTVYDLSYVSRGGAQS